MRFDDTTAGLDILATAFDQTLSDFGVDSLDIHLFDTSSTLLASATGAPIVTLDSFQSSGLALPTGDYLLSIFGDVTPGGHVFVSVAVATNTIAATPIPNALLLLLNPGEMFSRRISAFAKACSKGGRARPSMEAGSHR
jgi:hypothetical protein